MAKCTFKSPDDPVLLTDNLPPEDYPEVWQAGEDATVEIKCPGGEDVTFDIEPIINKNVYLAHKETFDRMEVYPLGAVIEIVSEDLHHFRALCRMDDILDDAVDQGIDNDDNGEFLEFWIKSLERGLLKFRDALAEIKGAPAERKSGRSE